VQRECSDTTTKFFFEFNKINVGCGHLRHDDQKCPGNSNGTQETRRHEEFEPAVTDACVCEKKEKINNNREKVCITSENLVLGGDLPPALDLPLHRQIDRQTDRQNPVSISHVMNGNLPSTPLYCYIGGSPKCSRKNVTRQKDLIRCSKKLKNISQMQGLTTLSTVIQ
jgi:hypothetical protein